MERKRLYIVFSMFAIIFFSSFVSKDSVNNTFQLFKIERSKDKNEIFYEVNISKTGELNTENPVQIYWIKHTDKGQKEPLTWIQNTLAYGLKFFKVNENGANFQFVSYNKRTFFIKKDLDGVFKVFTDSEKRVVAVDRIYIHLTGGTFWFPKIPKIELHATDMKSGEKTVEIIVP